MSFFNVFNQVFIKNEIQYAQKIAQKRIRKKSKQEKINVGFFVLYANSLPGKPLIDKMLCNTAFNPKIVLIPDTMRGIENTIFQLKKSYQEFFDRYPVVSGYDYKEDSYHDVSNDIDIAVLSNPYDCMTHQFFTAQYLTKKGVLCLFIPYSFSVSIYDRKISQTTEFDYFWKVFISTKWNMQELKRFSTARGKNAYVSGYCKMDDFYAAKATENVRKKIILAPHHTVQFWEGGVNLSTFLKYYLFFLELPIRYPQIDFVFRPHALLLKALSRLNIWDSEQVNAYLDKFLSNKNVTFHEEGDYFTLFRESDALIHDCGSFVAEYLYTGNPILFLYQRENVFEEEFSPLGQACLKHHYSAYNEDDILSFIDNVVLGGQDEMRSRRVAFQKEIRVGYPDVATRILAYLEKRIMPKGVFSRLLRSHKIK